jgi:deoxyadenosine/deoxycytidine kinase
MMSYLRPPDLIIGLRASVDTLMERIGQRGRDCEKVIPRDYLEELHRNYELWWERAKAYTQLLVVDTDQVDLLDTTEMIRLVEEVADRVGYQLEIPLDSSSQQ